MRILAIESSALVASCAVAEDSAILAESSINFKKTHSETLLPMIEDMLKVSGIDLDSIGAIAVSAGPGSFTGLRIGSATAKGLAMAKDLPVIAVPTLYAMACGGFGWQGLVVPVMDARRSQVYTAVFRYEYDDKNTMKALPTRLREDMAIGAEDLLELLGDYDEPVLFLGDGCEVVRPFIPEGFPAVFAPAAQNRQRAGLVACAALMNEDMSWYQKACDHAPTYLRLSQAEQEKERRGTGLPDKIHVERVRHLSGRDLDRIAQMEEAYFSDPWTREMIEETAGLRQTILWVARSASGMIYGYLFYSEVLEIGNIDAIAVDPDYRHRGLARRLIKKAVDRLGSSSLLETIFLEVRASNRPAISLYESLGFTYYHTRKHYYDNPTEDALMYRLDREKTKEDTKEE